MADPWAVVEHTPITAEDNTADPWAVSAEAPVNTGESVLGSGVAKAKLAYQEVGRMFDKQILQGSKNAEALLGPPPITALDKLQGKSTEERAVDREKEIADLKARIIATEPQYDPENPIRSTVKRAASSTVGLLGELPLFLVGGGAAGTAATAATKGLTAVAPKIGLAVKTALTQAGAFAGEAGLRGETPEEIATQAATGAAFGAAGQIAPVGLKTIAEGLVFVGAEKLKGNTLEAKDYGDILGTLIAMKMAGKAIDKVTDTAVDIKKAAAISKARNGADAARVQMAAEVMTSPEGKALVEKALEAPKPEKTAEEKVVTEDSLGDSRVLMENTPGIKSRTIEPSDIAQRPLFEGPTVAEQFAAASKANIEARTYKNKARIRQVKQDYLKAKEDAVTQVPLTPEELAYKSDYSLRPSVREEALVKLQEIFPDITPMERLSLLRERQKQVVPTQPLRTIIPAEKSVSTDTALKQAGVPTVTSAASKHIAEEAIKSWEPISPAWTADPTAEVGRPTHYYGIERGDFSTRKAEVVPVHTEPGVVAYNARTGDGRNIGTYSTPREAMQVVEQTVALPTPVKGNTLPPSQKGNIDPDLLLPKPVRMGVERINKDVKSILDVVKILKEARSDRKKFESEYEDLAKFNKFIAVTHGLLQIRDRNRNLPWLNNYVDAIQQQHQVKSLRLQEANDRLKTWQPLGREMGGRLTASMIEETVNKKAFTPEELAKYKLSPEALLVRQQIKGDFSKFLDDAEHLLRARAAGRLEGRALEEELSGIAEDFTALRSKPYFPLARWGREMVVAKRGNKTIEVETYESGINAEIAKARMKGRYKNDATIDVTRSYVPDSIIGLQGMPPRIVERMAGELLQDPSLSPQQAADIRSKLNDLVYKLAPETSWRKHLLKRKYTAGYSMDGMRAYASYMLHGANHLGRIQFGDLLTERINQGHLAAKEVQTRGLDNRDYLKLVDWMEKHRQYVMNPKNEWAQLRSTAFIWYLGFMPKAAFVNLTQVPLITVPYLAARFGDTKAMAAMMGAMKDAPRALTTGKKKLSSDERHMIDELMPILDESFASTLGATAEGGVLARVLPQTMVGRGLAEVSDKASYLFKIAEGYNRRVTALAAYRLNREAGLSHDEAVKATRETVASTQFEYASWNRPTFMRGKASILTVFMQYTQNMLYFLGRDPGAKRALVMLVAAAGVQGLPFMEDMLDILDRLLSTKNVKFDSRKELRELIKELDVNPDLIMHGTGRYGFGIPNADLSGSVSMGRPIRATEALLKPNTKFDTRFTDTAQSVGGAVLSVPIEMWKFAGDDRPDWPRAAERVMPAIGRSIAQAYRYNSEGKAKITGAEDVPITNPLDVGLTAAGFQLHDITATREKAMAVKDTQQYYAARHKELLDTYQYAMDSKQPEAVKDAGAAIVRFNQEVPFKSYTISISDLRSSLKQRAMRESLEEAGLGGAKLGADVTFEYAPAFPK